MPKMKVTKVSYVVEFESAADALRFQSSDPDVVTVEGRTVKIPAPFKKDADGDLLIASAGFEL